MSRQADEHKGLTGGYAGGNYGGVTGAPPAYTPNYGYPQQQSGYPPPPVPSYMHHNHGYNGQHGHGHNVVQVVQPQQVIIVGGCPSCRVGSLEDEFTCLGICCAVFFFPLGLLCCLAMRQRRCPNCGAIFT